MPAGAESVTRPINPTLVSDLWDTTTAHYGTRIASGSVDDQNRFDRFLADNHFDSTFRQHFAVTLGDVIYLPFRPGFPVAGPWGDLWEQIYCCGHEHHHIWQARQQEGVLYRFAYESDSTKRAFYETECYRVAMALAWHFNCVSLDPKQLAAKLQHYACSAADIRMSEKILSLSLTSIQAGALPGEVCRFVAGWLDARLR